MSCKSVADWLHREVESLDEAQRLVLDDHLATCASCRGDRARMQLVRAFGQSLPIPPPGAREYNRAIASALLEGKRVEQRERPRRLKWIVPIIAFASVATAATVAGVVATKNESTAPAPAPPETPARVEARIPEPEPEPEPEPARSQEDFLKRSSTS